MAFHPSELASGKSNAEQRPLLSFHDVMKDAPGGKQPADGASLVKGNSLDDVFGSLTIVDRAKPGQSSKPGTAETESPKIPTEALSQMPTTPKLHLSATESGEQSPEHYRGIDLVGRPLTLKQQNEWLKNGYVTEDARGEKELGKTLGQNIVSLADYAKEHGSDETQRYRGNELIGRPLTLKQMNQILKDGSITADPEGEKQLGAALGQKMLPLADWVKEHKYALTPEESKGRPLTARQATEYLRGAQVHEDPEGTRELEASLHRTLPKLGRVLER